MAAARKTLIISHQIWSQKWQISFHEVEWGQNVKREFSRYQGTRAASDHESYRGRGRPHQETSVVLALQSTQLQGVRCLQLKEHRSPVQAKL